MEWVVGKIGVTLLMAFVVSVLSYAVKNIGFDDSEGKFISSFSLAGSIFVVIAVLNMWSVFD